MSQGANHAVVLLVEDDLDIREAVADTLENAGYGVELAANGVEALDRLHRDGVHPAVVLLDLMMPVMNGWQFLEVFRAEGFTMPVILLTAALEADLPRDVPTLRKPVDNTTLLRAIGRALAEL